MKEWIQWIRHFIRPKKTHTLDGNTRQPLPSFYRLFAYLNVKEYFSSGFYWLKIKNEIKLDEKDRMDSSSYGFLDWMRLSVDISVYCLLSGVLWNNFVFFWEKNVCGEEHWACGLKAVNYSQNFENL